MRMPGRNAVVMWISRFRRALERLGGVLHEVEEHLDQLVAIAEHRRQRRIVFLGEGDVARDAGLGEQLHPVEHDVDVDRLALDRPVVAEHLDAVDEVDDAVDLLAHQPGQRQLVRRHRLLEQLRRAADARQRVLDLVRQHRGEAGDRARRAAAHQLPVDLVGHGALLEQQRHAGVEIGNRAREHVDDAVVGGVAEAHRADAHAIFGHRRAALGDRLRQRRRSASRRR